MGEHRLHVYILAGLCASLPNAAPVSDNFVVLVQPSVLVQRNSTTTLPCWLNSPQNTERLEVRWYRDNFDTPIMLYQAQTLVALQQSNYKDRVSFGLKDAASGGLKAGDVSLKLMNARIEDAGDYTCYVSSDEGYDKGSIRLSVIETGSSPFLSVEWKEGDKVNVSCESTGWYPQPKLRWSDQKQDLNPKHLIYSNGSSGLMSVHSWLLVSSSSEISCSVGLSDAEGKVARVHLENPPRTAKQDSGSSMAGWVAFTILLTSVLALAGLLYFKRRALFSWKKNESQRDQADEENLTEPLLKSMPTAYAEASKHYVNVVINNVTSEYLVIKDCLVRESNVEFPDGSQVTTLTAVRGTQGFSSGQHYWEVRLGYEKIGKGLKLSWWVGVTSATSFTEQSDTPDRFWFLSSSPDRADRFEFNTEPKVFFPISSRPLTIGVFLNYDSGEFSFYNADDKSLIGSLYVTFTGEVFPLFNPGKGDRAPLKILHKPVQNRTEQPGENSNATCNN